MIPPTMCPKLEPAPSLVGRSFRVIPFYPTHRAPRVDVIAEEPDALTLREVRGGVVARVSRARFEARYQECRR